MESPTLGVKFKTPTARLSSLAPGESVIVPVTFTIDRAAISGARIVAADGDLRFSVEIPVYPPATAFADYRIADGLTVAPYTHPLGEGNRDGHAAPGESFAILLPDAGVRRAAELFTSDTCVDNTRRINEAGTRISFPPSAPPANRATASRYWRASASTISPEVPVCTGIRRWGNPACSRLSRRLLPQHDVSDGTNGFALSPVTGRPAPGLDFGSCAGKAVVWLSRVAQMASVVWAVGISPPS